MPEEAKLIMEKQESGRPRRVPRRHNYPKSLHLHAYDLLSFHLSLLRIPYLPTRDLVADLWKAPKESKAIGTSTAGSSEAEMLGELALKEALAGSPEGGGERPLSPQHCGTSVLSFERFAT
jgi:hypothetical protein